MSDTITIRRAETIPDYLACQNAQRRAWGLTDEGYVVPVATMVGAQLHGGLVLGAFLPDGRAVGVSFAFLGRVDGRPCLYSQLTGVDPDYQSTGIGVRLKNAQREYARQEGIDHVAWAFDPLQAGNAHFNLDRLGATSGRYIVDMYGPRTDSLNVGLPTDRLIAEWDTQPRPRPEVPPDALTALPRLIIVEERGIGPLEVRGVNRGPAVGMALLEIPGEIKTLRRDDPARADRWQLAVRGAFLDAFAEGFRAVGFLRDERVGSRREFYLLKRGEQA